MSSVLRCRDLGDEARDGSRTPWRRNQNEEVEFLAGPRTEGYVQRQFRRRPHLRHRHRRGRRRVGVRHGLRLGRAGRHVADDPHAGLTLIGRRALAAVT